MTPAEAAPPVVVIDTNCVLDLWVFDDPAARALRAALTQGMLRWVATPTMRDELCRVLTYPAVARRLSADGEARERVLVAYDALVECVDAVMSVPVRCKDPDDQPFIDLAVAYRATLLSKDVHLLSLARRLRPLGVTVSRSWPDMACVRAPI